MKVLLLGNNNNKLFRKELKKLEIKFAWGEKENGKCLEKNCKNARNQNRQLGT